ncbi:MAG: hypothetical protein WBR26_14500 [Candidatus Acidiferrum sp.]
MPNIEIRLEAGTVTTVEGLPPTIFVEVFNYDVAGRESHKLSRDENGRP